MSRRPVLADGDWHQFAARLTELADLARSAGMTIAYHHHMGTIVQTEAEIDRLIDSDRREPEAAAGHRTRHVRRRRTR